MGNMGVDYKTKPCYHYNYVVRHIFIN